MPHGKERGMKGTGAKNIFNIAYIRIPWWYADIFDA